jgi:hypothetical protein
MILRLKAWPRGRSSAALQLRFAQNDMMTWRVNDFAVVRLGFV